MSHGSLTIVTALFDLSKREPELNRKSAADILETHKTLLIDAPMIIFCDPDLFLQIAKLRESRPTKIIPIPLETAHCYDSYHAKLEENYKTRAIVDGNKSKDTPLYCYVMWLKYILMKLVIDNKMYDESTTHLCWMDIGMSYVSDYTYIDEFLAFRSEKFRLVLLNHPAVNGREDDTEHYTSLRWICAGGLSMAPISAMSQHCSRFCAEYERAVFEGGFAPLDEQVTGRLLSMFPNDYEYSYGDYRSLISNFAGILRDNLERAHTIYIQAASVGDRKIMADLDVKLSGK